MKKKLLAESERFLEERKENKKNNKSKINKNILKEEMKLEAPVKGKEQMQSSLINDNEAMLNDILGGVSVDDLLNMESNSVKTLYDKIDELAY
jgi:CRISPR/Cas system-associated endonuclease Cas1